ncbi:oxidoreductase [Nonomuraea sp. NPDC050547]|uniref:oxidoreductase n=1 Tax=Nonomuraea sp. NPDC050547 TaxID=3364368 RepID=UPI0037A54B8B
MTTARTPDARSAGHLTIGGDLDLTRIGYGCMKLTGWPQGARRPDHDTALAVLRRAVELGVGHLDTSYYYRRDGVAANDLIREALHPYPAGLVIATKVGPIMEGEEDRAPGTRVGLTPDGLRRAVEANLSSLGVDRLDLVNLRMDGAVTPEEGSMEPALKTLSGLRDEGMIRHLGISNVSAPQLAQAQAIAPIVCVQNLYNVGRRRHEAMVDSCARAGIAFVPFFPISEFDEAVTARLAKVAARHDATVPQVALAWLLARSPSILVIPGTGSVAHLEENIAAADLRLKAEDLAELAG